MADVTPLFIFSLPRSGSTLVQRVLASHKEISSSAEPWVLLPFVYVLRQKGTYTEYSHTGLNAALQDFCKVLPRHEMDYYAAVRKAVTDLYQKASDETAVYFLDKTPRYHLICSEIINIFPEAKFIFLWRNPLAVISSIMQTWGEGNWNLYKFKIDLFDGMSEMIRSADNYKDKVLTLRYENFILNPEHEINNIAEYLGINLDVGVIQKFADIRFKGAMGDPVGTSLYKSIDREPINKWKRALGNPWRKAWCKRYLQWLGKDRLRFMGYDLDELLDELKSCSTTMNCFATDLVRAGYGVIYCFLEPTITKQKFKQITNWKSIKKHD